MSRRLVTVMAMAHPLLRASAVVSAVALLVGFVVVRSGVCDLGSSPKSSRPMTTRAPVLTTMPVDFEVFSGSKSGAVVPPKEKFRTMGGSKSLVITENDNVLFGDATTNPATQPATEPAR